MYTHLLDLLQQYNSMRGIRRVVTQFLLKRIPECPVHHVLHLLLNAKTITCAWILDDPVCKTI